MTGTDHELDALSARIAGVSNTGRLALGLTQEAAAVRCVSIGQLGEVERVQRSLRLATTIVKIADGFECYTRASS